MTPVGDPETGPGAHAAPGPGGATPFQRIAKAYGPAVLRVCRAMVGPVDADDAWSETFLAALRGYPSLAADADVEAWLVTIAQHKSVDLIRRRVRGPVPIEDLPTRAGDIGVPGRGGPFRPVVACPRPPAARAAPSGGVSLPCGHALCGRRGCHRQFRRCGPARWSGRDRRTAPGPDAPRPAAGPAAPPCRRRHGITRRIAYPLRLRGASR